MTNIIYQGIDDKLPAKSQAVKDNPEKYYVNGNNEWRHKDEITACTQVIQVGANNWTTDNTVNGNLWIMGIMSDSDPDHEGAATVQSNRWIRLNPAYKYKLEAYIQVNNTVNARVHDYQFYTGGNYGKLTNTPIGARGQCKPYIASGSNNSSLYFQECAQATVSGQTYVRLVNTGPATVNAWTGNISYAESKLVITCLGKV